MKFNKVILASALMLGFVSASAQDKAEKPQYDYHSNWYLQLQGGLQYTEGERNFGHLLSPNFQAAIGYNFNEFIGARLGAGFFQSKAGSNLLYLDGAGQFQSTKPVWTWKYVAPAADVTFNISNIIAGFNPKRFYNLSIFGGIGWNFALNNDNAIQAAQDFYTLQRGTYVSQERDMPFGNLWDGQVSFQGKTVGGYEKKDAGKLLGRVGLINDFRVNDRVKIQLELNSNVVNDKYNSKHASHADWYFNGLVGLKIRLGKGNYYGVVAPKPCDPETIYVDKPVEKIVEKTVVKEVVKIEPLRRDIFFTIASSVISKTEMLKVQDVADYLNNHPNAKVEITGYADVKTGNAKINQKYAADRAAAVTKALTDKFGIAADRISVDSKGDTVQPFGENNPTKNRVSICIAGE